MLLEYDFYVATCPFFLQILTSAQAVFTTAMVQLHVPTLLDPTTVHVTILIQAMEKLAIWHQVSGQCFQL